MKHSQKLTIAFAILTSLCLSCQNDNHKSSETEDMILDSIPSLLSSAAAVEKGKDPNRKFIRTADLKFKVKNVSQSTYNIEDITSRNEGFVIYTNLSSNTDHSALTPVSADSSLETTWFTVVNSMVLRVPNTMLDTTLKEIAKYVDYMDYRVIKADDVALQILSNSLAEKRNNKNETRLTSAIDSRGKKLFETAVAEEAVLNKQEQADNAMMANLALNDQVNYSTVNLSIYQRQDLKQELISNNKDITAYKPGIGIRLQDAFSSGLDILTSIIISIVSLWWLFALAVFGYLLYKKYRVPVKN